MTKHRYIYRFSYHIPQDQGEEKPHHLRDGAAFEQLVPYFYTADYRYGGLLFNYPHPSWRQFNPPDLSHYPDSVDRAELEKVDRSFLSPDDMLILTTRPPLDDHRAEDSRRVYPSLTTLEHTILKTIRPFFPVCARSQIHVRFPDPEAIEPYAASMMQAEFRLRRGQYYISRAVIREHKGYNDLNWQPPRDPNLTTLYYLRVPVRWEDGTPGPDLVLAFGMSGSEGLVWAYQLRTKFPDLLEGYRFVLAEMVIQPIPNEPPPRSLAEFADHWEINVLVNQAIKG